MWSVDTPDVVVGGGAVAYAARRSGDESGDLILLCNNDRAAPSLRERENDMVTSFPRSHIKRGERGEKKMLEERQNLGKA